MTRARRLHRILNVQARLVAAELAVAERQFAEMAGHLQAIAAMLEELEPKPSPGDAQQLAAGSDLSQRLRGTQHQIAGSVADLAGKVGRARQRLHKIECQQDRLAGIAS